MCEQGTVLSLQGYSRVLEIMDEKRYRVLDVLVLRVYST